MKVDFNNVRKQACLAYDKLIDQLNNCSSDDGEHILVDPDDLHEILNDLRMMIGTIAMSNLPGDDDVRDVYSELYTEGKSLAEFNPITEQ